MSPNGHTYLVSSILSEIREHGSVLCKGLILCSVLLLGALALCLVPFGDDTFAQACPGLILFALLGNILGVCCVVIIVRRIDTIRRIREEDLADEAAGLYREQI